MGCKGSKLPDKIVLYYDKRSAPCRTVLLTAAALDIKVELKEISIQKGEHMTPEFLKINPQHCIPTMQDGDFTLWESRAIAQYLVNQYASNDSLYPKEPKRRALVDARLNFDQGCLYQSFLNFFFKLYSEKVRDEALIKKMLDALELLNTFLEGKLWAAGETMTIADFSLASSVSTAECFDFVDLDKYPNVNKWLSRCKGNMKGYEEANQDGVNALKELIASFK